jgi:CRP/FNR family transcriptional regulator, cyclic AMP receptor protein
MTWVDILGYAASAAVLATFCMSTTIPLRILALGSNVLFMAYGYVDHLYPVFVLHAILFPVNVYATHIGKTYQFEVCCLT